ncbi:alanine racemase [Paracoccus sp. MC1854]|uniref:alanine racemase n=1 Tax=Paracoccus sp. MC1854 TaxID=2760306 RepID=UPI0015FF318E|nr:alanine racemase [Paracoccus sp. MC1854]MBB1490146.1 alanine racemase [Paracoccus sp. MC1854]
MRDTDFRHAGAVLEIDLSAIRHNYRTLRAMVGGTCAAVVKADAYGLGAAAVAQVLYAEGARQFFVAHLDEALALRPALPAGAEVFILNGLPPGAEADCAASGLIPVLNSAAQIDAWAGLARLQGRPLLAVVQVDSGMSRMGLPEDELEAVTATPERLEGITLRLVMSHLACAERQDHAMNRTQLAGFEAARRRLPAAPGSFANSSGIFLGSDFHFDLARPGAALYGIAPVANAPNPMRPVVRLRGRIVQIRDIPAGAQVGYGASWTAERPGRIATVSVGYADGYLRSLSHRAVAHVGEMPVPLVGVVSMDSITLDVTGAPAAVPGGFVDLIGPHNPVDAVATAASTIGYEVLTSLGSRYARAYADALCTERQTA